MTGGQKMTVSEAIDTIKVAMSEVEWEYPMEYYVAFDMAIKALDQQARNEEAQLPEIVRCKDCKYRSFYCTEATDGTTLYECHHPCANSVPRPGYWFCADGERKEGR